MSRWRFALALVASLAGACAPSPRPGILDEVDRVRTGAAAKEASALAPQAHLEAEKLVREAARLDDEGDRAGAELVGERALAAYARAALLSRLARADQRAKRANAALTAATTELAGVEKNEQLAAAEARDLEMRVRVIRDALPLGKSEPASPDRERARLVAARSMVMQARLLCVAAEMLTPGTPPLAEAWKAVLELEAQLDASPARTPIDEAVRLRSRCLSALTLARRPALAAAPEAGVADALFGVLAHAGLEPLRDDRGVVVVLRDLYQGDVLSPAASERVTSLGQVARAHPSFPVVAVLHGARGRPSDRDKRRAEALASALRAAGAVRVQAELAGDKLPVLPPGGPASAKRNERTEIVFVAPAP